MRGGGAAFRGEQQRQGKRKASLLSSCVSATKQASDEAVAADEGTNDKKRPKRKDLRSPAGAAAPLPSTLLASRPSSTSRPLSPFLAGQGRGAWGVGSGRWPRPRQSAARWGGHHTHSAPWPRRSQTHLLEHEQDPESFRQVSLVDHVPD